MPRFKMDKASYHRLYQLIINRHMATWQAYLECLGVGMEDVPVFRHSYYNQTEWEPARREELHHICYRSGEGGDYEENLIFISFRLHEALHANIDKQATEQEWRQRFLAYIHHPDVERWRAAHKKELDDLVQESSSSADKARIEKNRVDLTLSGMKHRKKKKPPGRKWPKRKIPSRKFSQRKK